MAPSTSAEHDGSVMTDRRRAGVRVPLMGLAATVLALLLLPSLVLGAGWTKLDRVTPNGGSRLDSLHQVAAARGVLHLAHPRIGPKAVDDKVVYQRSGNDGKSWSGERAIFKASPRYRKVAPNLAVDANGRIVAVAFRVSGPKGHTLFARVSRNGGKSFAGRVALFSTGQADGIGVPTVAIGDGLIAVAWTNRANGQVKVRTSRTEGKSFKAARTLGTTKMSIDCKGRVTDGLVGVAANGKSVHVAWSDTARPQCYADDVRVRTSLDRGGSWSPARSITTRDTFGWPELDARGKTVVATVQTTSGGLIVARSEKNGRNWREKVLAPPKGHIFSAADVALLPKKKAVLTYVKERLKNGKLRSTRLVTRRSPDDGKSWNQPKPVTKDANLLRMAPNVVANGGRVAVVVQSGQMDGSPRNIYASRRR